MPHKECCGILSTMASKDNRKQGEDKKIAASKSAPDNSYSDTSRRMLRKRKASIGVLTARTHQDNKTPKYSGVQSYCILCKKSGMTEHKWK